MGRWSLLSSDVVNIRQLGSEAEAVLIQRLLEDAHIPAVIRSRQVPGYGDIVAHAGGGWGDVLVPKAIANRAKRYVEDSLQGMKEGAV